MRVSAMRITRKSLVIGLGAAMAVVGSAAGPSLAAAAPQHVSSPGKSAEPVYLNPSYSPAERASDLVSRLTLVEKAEQMDSSRAPAVPRLGIAAWGWWNESNHGVNASTLTASGNATNLTNTTSYPSDLSLGSTWNPSLVYDEASKIGDEARDTAPGNTQNLDFYAPTVNLTRDPRWGRNDESWSEDPTLTANLASQYVNGLQGQNKDGQLPPSANGYYKAIATLKHFAANNSEVNRRNGSSDMDQRTLLEYYTSQFANIVQQSHPGSIMSSYNSINGVPTAASVQLMDTMARQSFGFNGYFTSDCDAIYEIQGGHHWQPPNASAPLDQYGRTAYANSAGEDLDCNAGYHDQYSYGNTIPTAISQHIKTETDTYNVGDVDTSLTRLFTARIEAGEFDSEYKVPWVRAARARLGGVTWTNSDANKAITETPARLQQAQDSAQQSLVLLKNKPVQGTSLLPLKVPHSGPYKIAVIGYYAHPKSLFLGGYSSIQGSAGSANNIDSYTGIKSAVQQIDPDAQVDYFPGVTGGTTGSQLNTVDQASIAAASKYDAVVVVAGTDFTTSSEDHDRTSLALPGAQSSMISQVEAANPRTIVYLETVGQVDTSSFQDNTSALLWSSFNGQRQGNALAKALLGQVNPNGHLPFTWYADEAQLPAITDYTIRPTTSNHGRTYMYFNGDVTWPFGYGQSYTKFEYSHLRVARPSVAADGTVQVTADVTNTGTTSGSTVPQLYVTTPFEPASAQRPAKRLEAFTKVTLAPGQKNRITLQVPASKLAFYDEQHSRWVVDNGTYGLELGTSSADSDIQTRGKVAIHGSLGSTPTVATAKPVEAGDAAADVAQRVRFDVGTTIDPQLTVAMDDASLYGYVTKGKSRPLPRQLTVRYRSNRPSVVQVGSDGRLRTVGSGVATVTAEVSYRSHQVSTSFVVNVAPLAITSDPAASFTVGTAGSFTVTTSTTQSPTAAEVPSLAESGALPGGLTFTDNGDGTATLAGTPAAGSAGSYPITVTARNGTSLSVTQRLTITVG